IPPHNLINVESYIILVPISRLHRDKVGRFSHPIHNNPFMMSPSPRKTNHKVNVNGLPLPRRNLNNLCETTRLKVLCLNLLTIWTPGYILSNVFHHAIPPIDLLEVMIHFGRTLMYRIPGTIGLCENLGSKINQVWDTKPVLVPKYAVTS
ncbi:hypothetical protein EJD97_004309, partial [Solanum chilense]